MKGKKKQNRTHGTSVNLSGSLPFLRAISFGNAKILLPTDRARVDAQNTPSGYPNTTKTGASQPVKKQRGYLFGSHFCHLYPSNGTQSQHAVHRTLNLKREAWQNLGQVGLRKPAPTGIHGLPNLIKSTIILARRSFVEGCTKIDSYTRPE